MILINEPISFSELWEKRETDLGDIIKIVVDVGRQIIGADEEMHADIEYQLLDQGSDQKDLWGANLLYGGKKYEIEYTSFINIRPGEGNRSMEIEIPQARRQVEFLIHKLVL